jgi:hypothetical protein
MQARIQTALISLPQELLSNVSADGYVVRSDDFYTIIRDLEASKQ